MRNITPNRLVLSYILDWTVIVIIAAIGYTWSNQTPIHRPFSLTDPNISYPETKHEKVPFGLALALALILPALVIALVIILRIPGHTVHKYTPRSVLWRYKLWEINAGWLGIALAVASAYATAKGLKLLFGKPRPDLLARCDPDLENVAAYVVGGLGRELPGAPVLVTSKICRNRSHGLTKTGFVSFPSDHASLSFAGLTYFSLWICSKFSIAFPYLPIFPSNTPEPDSHPESTLSIRKEGAAPPIYTLVFPVIPISVAFYIVASRWTDHKHHGVDLLFGSSIGILFAWIAFRLYNLPIQRGGGWSWGTRSRRNAFFKRIGFPSHVGNDNWAAGRAETGQLALV
ncbi:phosphatase PAP2 family protein [Aspergillus glaucus CBS 516.65]|uniref:Phosphatidic acid phosphatase type 2/haloperoxidase domain-containing protein n=1 Tax=Aspergillus glaucus CBS 516.65 TaxID=1160497 RepID=A0A1L9VHL4_ASPGL|nr:hypothetical protein ASPGLDRAFT_127621 [Aspergillus glaucus CBS 516.65]OJJ83416.1 hypothetical protein ASPGLDRAFT_127621 [Aspergillus glaucus CBS 516.65]